MKQKMKSNKSAAKRFKATGSGRFKRSKAFGSHILTKKARSRKRQLRQGALVHSADQKQIRELLPYA